MAQDSFRQLIVDHNLKPIGKEKVFDHNHQMAGSYPACGDEMAVKIKLLNDIVIDIGFGGSSCEIATASASLMCREIVGKHVEYVFEIIDGLQHRLYLDTGDIEPFLKPLTAVARFPSRVDCALLPWNTLEQMILETEAA